MTEQSWWAYCEQVMAQRSWNQSELARAIGVDPSVISGWKEGRQPGQERLRLMADSLELRIIDLYVAAGYLEPEEADLEGRPTPPAVPVGAGVDPALLAELADAEPGEIEKVRAYLRGIRDAGK